MQIHRAERVALVGPSGCGKTTMLRAIAGLQSLTSGRIERATTGATAFVFQQPALLPWRRVLENVLLPLELHDQHARKISGESHLDLARTALREVELEDAQHKFAHELSGGMQMRVSIARALVLQPQLLLLDEPFAALDDLLREQLSDLLMRLWRDHQFTMVMVTHNIGDAILLSDRVCLLYQGRILKMLANPVSLASNDDGQPQALSPSDAQEIRRGRAFADFYARISEELRAASELMRVSSTLAQDAAQ